MKCTVIALVFSMAAVGPIYGAVIYTGGDIFEDFDSLPTSSMTGGFFGLNGSPTAIPGAVGWVGTNLTTGTTNLIASTGSGTGGIHSLGQSGESERALGMLAAGSGAGEVLPAIGVEFVNMSSLPLREVSISFTQENWRRPGTGAGSTVAEINLVPVAYGTTASGVTSATIFSNIPGFTPIAALGLVSPPPDDDPNNPGQHLAAAALNGNDPLNQVFRTATINFSSNPIGIGESFFLTLLEQNNIGADATVAIDNFLFSAVQIPEPNALVFLLYMVLVGPLVHRRRLKACGHTIEP